MEERRRGVGAGMVKFVFALLLLTILCGRLAVALDDDGELLMLFKLLMLDGWSVSDASACAWNGVICNGFPAPQQAGATANVTSTTDGISNTTTLATVPARANGTTTIRGLNASAVTVSRVIGLVLPNAQLSATLPPDLARLQHLRHLDLSGNKVTGTLPPALLLNATDLRVLALAGNDITGSLPDGAPSHGLQELNLSDNALAGWLPDTLLTASGLTVLGLANNYLVGGLPSGGLGAQLEVVDLSSNYFRGPLPPDFGGSRLRILNVSSNRLTGALPAELSDVVPANTTVDLSNNNFTGVRGQPGAVRPAAEARVLHPLLALQPAQRHRLVAGVRGHPQERRAGPAGIPRGAGTSRRAGKSPSSHDPRHRRGRPRRRRAPLRVVPLPIPRQEEAATGAGGEPDGAAAAAAEENGSYRRRRSQRRQAFHVGRVLHWRWQERRFGGQLRLLGLVFGRGVRRRRRGGEEEGRQLHRLEHAAAPQQEARAAAADARAGDAGDSGRRRRRAGDGDAVQRVVLHPRRHGVEHRLKGRARRRHRAGRPTHRRERRRRQAQGLRGTGAHRRPVPSSQRPPPPGLLLERRREAPHPRLRHQRQPSQYLIHQSSARPMERRSGLT